MNVNEKDETCKASASVILYSTKTRWGEGEGIHRHHGKPLPGKQLSVAPCCALHDFVARKNVEKGLCAA